VTLGKPVSIGDPVRFPDTDGANVGRVAAFQVEQRDVGYGRTRRIVWAIVERGDGSRRLVHPSALEDA
jgi:hypothetical protein